MILCSQLVDKPTKALNNDGSDFMDHVITDLDLIFASTILNFLVITVRVCTSRFRFFRESKSISWPVFGFDDGITRIFSEFANDFE